MSLALQIMMAVGLAACCGLRAWLPLFLVGLLGRLGHLPLGEGFRFISSTPALIVFAVASLIELLGDKIPIVDHFLDLIGTFLRPLAGMLVFASVLAHLDPLTSLILGLIAGSGTSLAVHGGKAALRAKSTAASPLHLGCGNTILSFLEDLGSSAGVWIAVHAPVIIFVLALLMIGGSIWMITRLFRSGARLFARRPAAGGPGSGPGVGARPAEFEIEE